MHWRQPENLGFSEDWQYVPLVLSEIEHFIPIAPVAFVQHSHPEQGEYFELVGLLSPLPRRNLYLRQDKTWVAGYVPAWIRMYPFRPLQPKGRSGEYVMCLEQASICDQNTPGSLLFTADGQASDELQRVVKFMGDYVRERAVTDAAVKCLHRHDLIEPWPIELRQTDGKTQTTQGLFHINGKKLATLEGDALAELCRCGGLHIAYAQLLSKQRSMHFSRLLQAQGPVADIQPQDVDVEAFFGKQDDTLKFDF
jgi:hypothetical protein